MAREVFHRAIYHLGKLGRLENGLESGMTLPDSFSFATWEVRVRYDKKEIFEDL